MPYISEERRLILDQYHAPLNPGELNYCITKMLLQYLDRFGRRYNTFNEVIGVLDCVGQEWYRRMVAPYEDQKLAENGDVYSKTSE